MRPSQILLSEKLVSNVVNVLSNEYLNPFDVTIDKDCLYNLSSGEPVSLDLATSILEIPVGSRLSATFTQDRIRTKNVAFHRQISRNKYVTFTKSKQKVKITKDKQTKSIEVNRDILGTLLRYSIKSGKELDFEKALMFPMSPVPLSLANADGTKRKTNKSQLAKILLQQHTGAPTPEIQKEVSAYIIDLIALVRTMREIPKTFEDLSWKIINSIPRGWHRIDFVADTYRKNSMKSGERDSRGTSSKVVIQSNKSKIPRDFTKFMSNGENKTRMFLKL